MENIDTIRGDLPDYAKDLRLNLSSVLDSQVLSSDQIWGVAAASALSIGEPQLRQAVLADAAAATSEEVLEDARAAAAIMGMNTVYYRFRHLIGKESYTHRPARLRMQVIGKPKTSKTDFELFCLAVAALAGCEVCLQAHEKTVLAGGLGEEHVQDAVRIAAVLQGTAVALSC